MESYGIDRKSLMVRKNFDLYITGSNSQMLSSDILMHDYIQSPLTVETKERRLKEIRSLTHISYSFKKIVIVKDKIIPWHDEQGILYIGIEQFLLEASSLDL